MILKQYQNELLLTLAIVLALGTYGYKQSVAGRIAETKSEAGAAYEEISTIVALMEQWGNPKLESQMKQIKGGIPAAKVRSFEIKAKKLNASLAGLNHSEMNGVLKKLQNSAVAIVDLSIKRKEKDYDMEFTCKW